ncbi:MAG: hypothetical protein LBP72_03385 [Dysgonamonadaceae bacterium]|jgi:hypothetical protein|nr:hypothetical protein [Dysgonamonadaceae bacterium]
MLSAIKKAFFRLLSAQIRYLSPPTVTIDGVPCTEVVVLSPHFRYPKAAVREIKRLK